MKTGVGTEVVFAKLYGQGVHLPPFHVHIYMGLFLFRIPIFVVDIRESGND